MFNSSETPATEIKDFHLQLEPALAEELEELKGKSKDELAKEVLRLAQQNEQLIIAIDILSRLRSPLDYNQAIENQVAVLTRAVDSLMQKDEVREKAEKKSEKETA
ncbi:MAG: hypothetical protein ACRBF0_10055 [Calditrichia bacterium]